MNRKFKKIGAVYGSYYYTNENGEVIGEEKIDYIENNLGPPHGACTLFNYVIKRDRRLLY